MSAQSYASASLYVGDLAPEVTEALLFEIFKTVGPVASIRVCRDALTRRSLGYAYVNFHNVADAERAVETLNYTTILGKQCRIMWSHRDPAKRKSGVGNIFIKNLDKSIDNSSLYETFSAFGHILSCKVEVDQNGVSKGYGYVHFETGEEAEQAIAKVNGMLMNGKKVYVGPFKPRKERTSDSTKQKFTNIFVKNLDTSITTEQLAQKFGQFGPITSAVVMANEKGESKGFGFVNFESAEDAYKAVEAINGTEWNGKIVYVGRAQKKHEREEEIRQQKFEQLSKYQGINIYVKNLDDSIDDDRLRQEFSKFGTITSARIMRDEKGNSKGFGFICFTTPEEATRAITEMNGYLLVSKPLYVGLAQRKEVRRAQLEALHNQKLQGMRMAQQPNVLPPMGSMGYPNGGPVFFQPGAPMPQPPRVMYPQQMVPRPRFNGNAPQGQQPRQGFQAMPNYVVPVGQRQQPRPRRNQPPAGVPPTSPSPQQGQVPPQPGAAPPQGPAAQANGKPRTQPPSQPRGFKYTSTARNQVPPPVPVAQPVPMPHQAMGMQQMAPMTTTLMTPPEQLEALMGTEESKQMIGEQLYGHISRMQPQLAGKITGMFLESLDLRDLLSLLQNRVVLDAKIQEAITVLHEHEQRQPDGPQPVPPL
jgi:polyadenylate-binding protein